MYIANEMQTYDNECLKDVWKGFKLFLRVVLGWSIFYPCLSKRVHHRLVVFPCFQLFKGDIDVTMFMLSTIASSFARNREKCNKLGETTSPSRMTPDLVCDEKSVDCAYSFNVGA